MNDPIRAWIRTDPVRRWIGQAASSWKRNRGWPKVGIGLLIVILICVFLVVSTVVLLALFIKALGSGGHRNKDLYIPGKFVNRDLYLPSRRK